jgi:hypothetical protein
LTQGVEQDEPDEDDVVEVERHTVSSDIGDSTSLVPTIAVQDYIFRGDQLQDYSLYELTMWTTVVTMSHDKWMSYLAACDSPEKSQSSKWQVRVAMRDEHPQQIYGSVRAVMFHKAERVPLLIGTSIFISDANALFNRTQNPTFRFSETEGMACIFIACSI